MICEIIYLEGDIMPKNKLRLLLLISVAHATIYAVPYLQTVYYDAVKNAYGFSHIEMGNLISVFAIFNCIAYLAGGIVADTVNTKKLFLASVTLTGLAGLYSATLPSYEVMIILSASWSFTTTMAFWSAMIKSIKLLASESEQGRIFGIKETLVCVLGFVFSMIGLHIFNKTNEDVRAIIVFYSVICLILGVFIFIYYPSTPQDEKLSLKVFFNNIKLVLKLKSVWLIGALLFCCVSLASLMGRFTPFMSTIGGYSASFVAFFTILASNGFANIGSYNGGKIADKMGSASKFISKTLLLTFFISLLMAFMPYDKSFMSILLIIIILVRIINGALRTCYFATMGQFDIPKNLIGTASGVISVIGFSPEMFMFTFTGAILEDFSAITAYRIIFFIMAVSCLIGAFIGIYLDKYAKKEKMKIEEDKTLFENKV